MSTGDLLTPDEFVHCMFMNLSCQPEDQTGAGILNKKVGGFAAWEIVLSAIPGGAGVSHTSKILHVLVRAKSKIKIKLPASKPRVNAPSQRSSGINSDGARSARTPIGARGKPLNINSPNTLKTISQRQYSVHALDRMQRQGIMPSVVENATRSAPIQGKYPGTTAFYDEVNDLTVIIDTNSERVITVDYGRIRQ